MYSTPGVGPDANDRAANAVGPAAEPPRSGERFELIRELGAGGMGVVHEAVDRASGERVALKTLRRDSPLALDLFKNEFRSLADLLHPNLVHLRDLLRRGDTWCYTMELVDGAPLLDSLRSGGGELDPPEPPGASGTPPSGASTPGIDDDTLVAVLEGETLHPMPLRPLSAAGVERLRHALPQLVEGVRALHRSGRLHRDIKPSNVLIERGGRVVLLDFGLVTRLEGGRESASGQEVHGTLAYMAPEQATGRRLTPASDWYAVGALLYQALTGRLPFAGSPKAVLAAKRWTDPPGPRELAPGLPEDLCSLAMDLLRREPTERPGPTAILERLGLREDDEAEEDRSGERAQEHGPPTVLVGRAAHLSLLRRAASGVPPGRSRAVFVDGESGMGKTALIEHFLAERRDAGALILRARCFERDWLPYRALDPVLAALAAALSELPEAERKPLLPPGIRALAHLFPVLSRLPLPREDEEALDPAGRRRLAAAALAELLARVAERREVVVFLDDLQWGDLDSAELLEALLPPEGPPILLLASHRPYERGGGGLLDTIDVAGRGERVGSSGAPLPPLLRLGVGALSTSEAQALVRALLALAPPEFPGASADPEPRVATLARESGGVPFFIRELAWAVRAGAEPKGEDSQIGLLDRVLAERVRRLAPHARAVLEVVCLAGRPVDRLLVRALAPRQDGVRAEAALRSEGLIRSVGAAGSGQLAPTHDRVREATVSALGPERRTELHRRFADALVVRRDPADMEAIARHYAAAGKGDRVTRWAVPASDQAAAALALDRAADLMRLALSHSPPGDQRAGLLEKLGGLLALAGRGPEAAEVLLQAAEGADVEEAQRRRARAADQLLRAGHLVEGRRAMLSVLDQAGMPSRGGPLATLLGFLIHRIRVGLRGLRFDERAEQEVPPALLRQVDLTWAASQGFSLFDTLRGATFQARNLLLSLQAGESGRVTRALAAEAAYASVGGARGRKRAEGLLSRAWELAEQVDDPYGRAMTVLSRSIAGFQAGDWRRCRDEAADAARRFADECRDAAWEGSTSAIYELAAMQMLGEVGEVETRLVELSKSALERGDLHAWIHFRLAMPLPTWAVADRADQGLLRVAEAAQRWPDRSFGQLSLHIARSQAQLGLYRGVDPAELRAAEESFLLLRRRPDMKGIRVVFLLALELRLRAALGEVALGADRPDLDSVLRSGIRTLSREGLPWCRALSSLASAQREAIRGDDEAARRGLQEAAGLCEAAEMRLHAAAARVRLGRLLGGDEGRAMARDATDWMRARRIRRPERMTAVLVPIAPGGAGRSRG